MPAKSNRFQGPLPGNLEVGKDTRQHLRREWFFEQGDGNCRLMGSFAARLSELAPAWRRSVAPVAEWVARAFWLTIRKPDTPFATRLTQNNKREAKGAPAQTLLVKVPSQQSVCAGCHRLIPSLAKWHSAKRLLMKLVEKGLLKQVHSSVIRDNKAHFTLPDAFRQSTK